MSRRRETAGSGIKNNSIDVRRSIPRPLRNQLRQGVSVDTLVENARVALDNLDLDEARKLIDQALRIDRKHCPALEVKALINLEEEKPEDARKLLLRAVDLDPDTGFSKYMYLGQIETGELAAQYYAKGIEIMASEAEDLHEQGDMEELAQMNCQISTGFCALAELYLTDLCEVDDAETTCRTLLEKALQYDERNIQALQSLASYYISMQDPATALDCIHRSLAIWFRPRKDDLNDQDQNDETAEIQVTTDVTASQMDVDADDDEYEDVEDEDEETEPAEPPPYEMRIGTAKLLIELGDHLKAVQVLDQLVDEDEEVMQVWYLIGWAAHLASNLDRAEEALVRANELFIANDCEDKDVLRHIEELLVQCRQQSQANGSVVELGQAQQQQDDEAAN